MLSSIQERSATEFANVRTNATAEIAQAAAATKSAITEVQGRLRGLTTGQADALSSAAAAADTRSQSLTEASQSAFNGLSSELGSGQTQANAELGAAVAKAVAALAVVERRSSDHDGELRHHVRAAMTLSAGATALREKVNALVERVAEHVSDARTLKEEIGQTIGDVNRLGEHGTPAFTKVSQDLGAVEQRAQAVLSGASGLKERVAGLGSASQRLQGAAANLASRAEEIAETAGEIGETIHRRIAGAVEELESRLAGFRDLGQGLHEKIEAARARFEAARGRAKAKFGTVKEAIAARLTALQGKVRAAAGTARAAAQQKLAEAESEYAHLLALVQIGRDNDLPGGNATGAIVQTGIYVYEITGSEE